MAAKGRSLRDMECQMWGVRCEKFELFAAVSDKRLILMSRGRESKALP